jgi:hypothetical protein
MITLIIICGSSKTRKRLDYSHNKKSLLHNTDLVEYGTQALDVR